MLKEIAIYLNDNNELVEKITIDLEDIELNEEIVNMINTMDFNDDPIKLEDIFRKIYGFDDILIEIIP